METLQQKPEGEVREAPSGAGGAGAGMSTVTGLLGAPEGAALRRVAFDADSLSLAQHLTSAQGRPLRRAGVRTLASALQEWHRSRAKSERDASAERREEERREAARQRAAVRVIITTHISRLLRGGIPGLLAFSGLLWVTARVGIVAAARACSAMLVTWLLARFQRRDGGTASTPAPA